MEDRYGPPGHNQEQHGPQPLRCMGWHLKTVDPGQDFWFPNFELQPGQECRVYTNEVHPEHCGFNFGHTGSLLWVTSRECGHLYDPSGAEVPTYCYEDSSWVDTRRQSSDTPTQTDPNGSDPLAGHLVIGDRTVVEVCRR